MIKNKVQQIEMQAEETWAVKYRPMKLSEIMGQTTAVANIKGMIKRKKVPHTILLTGEAGSGKTSIARIIAKLINGFDMNKDIDSYSDIVEINASKERGIDEVRGLLKSINFMPQEGKFKVFILDEVHQQTPQAADAMLKPLEEPPNHVIWILATNEPQKLKETTRRRCSPIWLEQNTPEEILPLLDKVCEKENVFQPAKKYIKLLKYVAQSTGGKPGTSLQLMQALANINASNPIDVLDKENLRQTLKETMRGMDIGVEKIAVAILLALYSHNNAIKFIADTSDYAALSWHLLDLNGYIIEKKYGNPGWSNYNRNLLVEYMKKKETNPGMDTLAYIQTGLVALRREVLMSMVDPKQVVLDRIITIAVLLNKNLNNHD